MKRIAVTQRVDIYPELDERRDVLDQRWIDLLNTAGLTPVIMPNNPELAIFLFMDFKCEGLLLTGGNSLMACEGNAPERDDTEFNLLELANQHHLPVLGVCRGMQMLQMATGQQLEKVEGHIMRHQGIVINELPVTVNSYHTWGTTEVGEEWNCWARSDDLVVKAISHTSQPWLGMMWHPERISPFRREDVALIKQHFGGV